MCGRSAKRGWVSGRRGGDFFGVDVETMGRGARVAASLVVLVPVAISGLLLVALAPGFWWIFTTYGWVAFPAMGLLARTIAEGPGKSGAVGGRDSRPVSGERELLGALGRKGSLTAAGAALETSLSVAEAERMLGELAKAGHLEVRASGGIFYSLWEAGGEAEVLRSGKRRELAREA